MGRLIEKNRPLDFGGQDRFHLLGCLPKDKRVSNDAGAVKDTVQSAVCGGDPRDELINRFPFRHVGPEINNLGVSGIQAVNLFLL